MIERGTGMKGILVLMLSMMLTAVGCGDPIPPAAPTPVSPTIEEPFTGTLAAFGSNVHPFTVKQVGGLVVIISSVAPSAAVGVGIGTPSVSTGTCTVLSSLTVVAGPGAQLSGTATIAGTFCVQVFDVGNLVESVAYTITVIHS
jgi:hypothetical protein